MGRGAGGGGCWEPRGGERKREERERARKGLKRKTRVERGQMRGERKEKGGEVIRGGERVGAGERECNRRRRRYHRRCDVAAAAGDGHGATPSPPPTAAVTRPSGRWAGGDGAEERPDARYPLCIALPLYLSL